MSVGNVQVRARMRYRLGERVSSLPSWNPRNGCWRLTVPSVREDDIVELQTRSGHLLIFFESLALAPALCKGRSKCYIAYIHASDLCVLF